MKRKKTLLSFVIPLIAVMAVCAALFGLYSLRSTTVRAIEPDGFACDGTFYQTMRTSGTTRLYTVDRASTPYTTTQIGADIPLRLNGAAFDPITGYIYAWEDPSNRIRIINNTGAVIDTHTIAGIGAVAITGAVMDSNGVYYGVVDAEMDNTLQYFSYDTTSVPPYTPAVHTLTSSDPSFTVMTDRIADLVIDPTNSNYIYGAMGAELLRIDIAAGTIDSVGQIGDPLTIGTMGTLLIDAAGEIYGYSNLGAFYQINKTTGIGTLINSSPVANSSDGASCGFETNSLDTVKSVVSAPTQTGVATYTIPYTVSVANTTTPAAPSPNVQLTEALSRTFSEGTPTITISTAPVVTTGSCTANLSFNGLADTRLLSGTDILAAGASCTVTFTVQVAYASAADVPDTVQYNTVYASSTSLANNPGYTFNTAGDPTPPIQLLAADQSTNSPTLPATSHADTPSPTPVAFEVASLALNKSASPASGLVPVLLPGTTVTYSVEVAATGNVPTTATVTDTLDDVLTGATLVPGSLTATSSDSSVVAAPVVTGTTLTWNGVIAPGESVRVTYRVVIADNTTGGTLTNRVVGSGLTPSSFAVVSNCVTGTETGCQTEHAFGATPVAVEPPVEEGNNETPGVPNTGLLTVSNAVVSLVAGLASLVLAGVGLVIAARKLSDK